ncbi:hypothetical protein AQUCO_04500009v1 [Aquilegia coerulea]|uniref:Mitochondrial 28S ribosomal protein S34 n=1 Tax=Aquilegia coerulea TaxID=218851 RepID=A0A2G5CLF6_AQUCA|nr:hypothetical protein AQUCO_04500009v1 [Aquilegia coerulea]
MTILQANRVAAMERTLGLFRNSSFNLIRRRFSASSTTPTSRITATSSTILNNKPKRKKKKKNLFEVAQFLPNWGIGYQMAKTHWVGISYQITKVNLYKDGRHGKAWGIVHKEAADAPKKISGVHKRCWSYIPTKKTVESTPNAEVLAA